MRFFVVAAATLLLSSCFELERSRGLGEGSVRFVVRDSAGAPVPGAVVSVDASRRMATSDDNGVVVVGGLLAGDYLLRVGVDDDGDGGFDRSAIASASLAVVPVDTGVFTADEVRLTSVELGDVELVAAGSLTGSVSGCGDVLCRVIVFREVAIGSSGRVVTGVVEAAAGVDGQGGWSLTDVGKGPIKVAAFAWPTPAETDPLQQMIAANRTISAVAVVDVDVGSGAVAEVALVLAPAPPSVATTLDVVGDVTVFERSGGQAFFLVPQSEDLDVDASRVGTLSAPQSQVEAPLGVFDVRVQIDGAVGGLLLHAAGVPGVATIGPVLIGGLVDAERLALVTTCSQVDERDDCDGDGVAGDDCDTADVEGDADDDGDGQPDCEEAPACRGPGLGTDLDGDCLCEPADPVPGCASNNRVDCNLLTPLECPAAFSG